MREPEAGRLAARLLLLYGYDRASARLLGRLAELHLEAARRLEPYPLEGLRPASLAPRPPADDEEAGGAGPEEAGAAGL